MGARLGDPAVMDGQLDEGLGDSDIHQARRYQQGQGDAQAGYELPFEAALVTVGSIAGPGWA